MFRSAQRTFNWCPRSLWPSGASSTILLLNCLMLLWWLFQIASWLARLVLISNLSVGITNILGEPCDIIPGETWRRWRIPAVQFGIIDGSTVAMLVVIAIAQATGFSSHKTWNQSKSLDQWYGTPPKIIEGNAVMAETISKNWLIDATPSNQPSQNKFGIAQQTLPKTSWKTAIAKCA